MFSIDIFTLGAIYNYVSYDPTTRSGGDNKLHNLLYWFIGSNAFNVVVFFAAVVIWKNHSNNIIEEVDDNALTPTDYTLRISNIPKEWKVPQLKEILSKISDDLEPVNIHIAKKFDNRIMFFKDFVIKANVLKDARTIK